MGQDMNSALYCKKFDSVTLRAVADTACLKGAPLVLGMATTSISSILAAGFLRENLKLPILAIMTSSDFPARCVVENGVALPAVRIYGNSKMAILTCEFKLAGKTASDFVEAIFDFCHSIGISRIVGIEGLPAEMEQIQQQKTNTKAEMGSSPQNLLQTLTGMMNNSTLNFIAAGGKTEETCKFLEEEGHKKINEAVIHGVNGLVLAEAQWGAAPLPALCLVTNVGSRLPDLKSAIVICKLLTKFFELPEMDLSSLQEKADVVGNSVKMFLNQEDMKINRPLPSDMYL